MEDKKISIIVPIYNVENYLRKCIDSILSQTYKNLEIILVDDGAADNCPAICDEYAKKDDRIVVVHKENGGLSDARNAGIDVSTGDYIGFVDSDDYIAVDMFEMLINAVEKYDADVSCCRYIRFWEDGETQEIGNDGSEVVYDGVEALKEYLYGVTLDPFAWNKLYKASFIGNKTHSENHLRFIKGILGEDNPFCIELFKHTEKTVVVGKSKYYYLQKRTGAITNSGVSQKKIDSVYFWDEVRLDCKENYPELEKYALRREVLFYVGLYNMIIGQKEYEKDAQKIRSFIKEHLGEIKSSDICEKTVKTSATLLAKTPHLYKVAMKLYKKVIGEARL
ncbi:MAG: glycosyltransferase [Oscillospiraceae bacterium]|nr:glycosyltransferase [Candidatus Ruminococcus equi]